MSQGIRGLPFPAHDGRLINLAASKFALRQFIILNWYQCYGLCSSQINAGIPWHGNMADNATSDCFCNCNWEELDAHAAGWILQNFRSSSEALILILEFLVSIVLGWIFWSKTRCVTLFRPLPCLHLASFPRIKRDTKSQGKTSSGFLRLISKNYAP